MSDKPAKVDRSEEEWRNLLTPEQFHITRQHGTEPPFTGPHLDTKEPGEFACVCCGQRLFLSATKYESGSGWPSFYEPAAKEAITNIEDHSHGMHRVEVRCSACDAHLGHVFPDGPRPTGLRYCINGHALTFTPSDDS